MHRGVVSHEFNLRFNSPTVNLWFGTKDYLKFLNNMQHYLYDCDLVQDEMLSNQYGYPVGILGDIKIFFSTILHLMKQNINGMSELNVLNGIIYM